MKIVALLAAASGVALAASSASAAVIYSPEAAYVPFPVVNATGAGPESLTSNITWTSTNASNQGGSVYGWNQGYSFLGNSNYSFGTWTVVGLNDSSGYYGVVDSMTFNFATPVKTIGAVLNWVTSQAPVTIAAYNSDGGLLDTLTLSANGVNLETPDRFYGFAEDTADISKFVLTDGYVAAIGGLNGVPEPAAWALMLVGFAGLGAALRTHRQKAAVA
jgi:hypothetical protein